jgi:hypothetical protein
MSYVLSPVDSFDRPDSPTLGPDWLDEKVFPPYLHIVDGNAAGDETIAGAAYIGGAVPGGAMVLTEIDLHDDLAVLGVSIGDLHQRDGAPYGDPTYAGGTTYIWPGYRVTFTAFSVTIVQVGMKLVDVGEAYPVALAMDPVTLAHIDVLLPTGPVELAVIPNGDEIDAYVNRAVVLTGLGTGGLGIVPGGVAFWLQGNAIAGGAGGAEPPPAPLPVSLNHPLANRLLAGPRLSSTPAPGVSLNAKLLDGA